ncbi:MAG: hypothetical protein OXE50_15240 [Chloroflexi bacterium]|nr:hypothetical protein [Chloroflexota bacterium]
MRAGGETIDRAMPVRRGRQCSPVMQTMPPAWPGDPVSPGKRVEALRSVGRMTGAAGQGNSLERRGDDGVAALPAGAEGSP